MIRDVVIIGAGAAGLMCAAEAGRRGRSVAVLDHASRMGRKIRVSGGGRCNFTNLRMDRGSYISGNRHFCTSAISRFGPAGFMSLLDKYGVPYCEKENGQMFCVRSSSDILEILEKECSAAGVSVMLKTVIHDVKKEGHFLLSTSRGTIVSESLVVATGGLSYPSLGATGFGMGIASEFGIGIVTVRPALVPLLIGGRERTLIRKLRGISFDVAAACGKKTFRGGILFTHRGISGPVILQISSYWREREPIVIDLLPEMKVLDLFMEMRGSRMELKNLLARYLPQRFCRLWTDQYVPSKPLNRYSEGELKDIAERLHRWTLSPEGTEGYDKAEVTLGGVDTSELSSKTMEAKKVPGLYFIGEVVDVTGHLGGYNLHWAWASGHAAGQYA